MPEVRLPVSRTGGHENGDDGVRLPIVGMARGRPT